MSDVNTYRFKRSVKILKREITKDSHVVEVGSSGASFKEFIQTGSWTCIDKFGNPDISAELDGVETTLPINSQTVDACICTEVLEHLRCGTPLVKELYRILKPGGSLFVSVPNIVSIASRFRWMFGKVPSMAASGDCGHPLGGTGYLVDGHWVAAHVVDFNKDRLRGYLKRAGFSNFLFYKMAASYGPLRIPPVLTPRTMANFLFVQAKKDR